MKVILSYIDHKVRKHFITTGKKIANYTCTLTLIKSYSKILTAYSILSSVPAPAIMSIVLVI